MTGNIFNDLRSSSVPWAINLQVVAGTTITGNTFDNESTSNSIIYDHGGNSGNSGVQANNTFLHN